MLKPGDAYGFGAGHASGQGFISGRGAGDGSATGEGNANGEGYGFLPWPWIQDNAIYKKLKRVPPLVTQLRLATRSDNDKPHR